jgi:hypothetical protein
MVWDFSLLRRPVSRSPSAITLTIRSPFFATCTSTISINGSTPSPACATGDSFFTIDSLPPGRHRFQWNAGTNANESVAGVQFWGIAGRRDVPPRYGPFDCVMLGHLC